MKAKLSLLLIFLMASASMAQLAGYWNFDEGTGTTAADSSGNGKNGVLSYNTVTSGGTYPEWIAGHDGTGSALLFNSASTTYRHSNRVIVDIGSADYLSNLLGTGRAFTISMWVRTDALLAGNWRYPIYTDAYAYWLALDPNDQTPGSTSIDDFFSSDANSAWYLVNLQYAAPVQKEFGTWYHLALSYDGNFLKRYINGKFFLLYVPAPINNIPVPTTEFFIGSKSDGRNYFKGALDDIAIWSGTYLSDEEIAKLANGTATPLTVIEHAPDAQLPVVPLEAEPGMGWNMGVKGKAWNVSGWAATWSCGFAQQMRLISNADKTAWSAYTQDWCLKPLLEGDRSAVYTWCHMLPVKLDDVNIYEPNWTGNHPDVDKFGVEWIDRSWDPGDMNGTNEIATIAAYITPGYAICDGTHDYTAYDPCENRYMPAEDKPYFKTYARFATENAPAGCKLRVRQFTFPNGDYAPQKDPTCLTPFAELLIPIVVGNHQWQEFKGTLPKPGNKYGRYWDGTYMNYLDTVPQELHEPMKRVWFEVSIQGGDADTVLYVDEFAPISDEYIQEDPNTSVYREGDVNKNSLVYWDDIETEADSWLDSYNFVDYADTTRNWLLPLFNNISGDRNDPNW
ncbi:MAG: LamG domain-containing protein [Phycisphaerales bacterium]